MTNDKHSKLFYLSRDMILAILEEQFNQPVPPTHDELVRAAEAQRQLVPYKFTDKEFAQVLVWLESRLTIRLEEMDSYLCNKETYTPWLADEEQNITWRLYERYENYLERGKHWVKDVVANLNTTSRKVLDLIGNPCQKAPFLRRGLVIGDVQSGKTATYTAICARAADAGYNAIVVLTGIQEDLRRQTQNRLDKELVGRRFDSDKKAYIDTIVNEYDETGLAKDAIVSVTTEKNDFGQRALQQNNFRIDIFAERATMLFVCKKNKKILEALDSWLAQSEEANGNKINRSILIIDDESDNASVNTKDQNFSAINAAIRNIMNHFTKSSYVGVTATPFANIFIRPDLPLEGIDSERLQNDALYRDLFPSDFIYVLGYPNNYIGAKGIFDSEDLEVDSDIAGKYDYMLEQIDQEEIKKVFPADHNKDFQPEDLPSDLYKAMRYFIIANAIRDARGDINAHKTMMIHISRFKAVHKEIFNLVNGWLTKVKREVKAYSELPLAQAESNSQELIALHQVFQQMNMEEMAKMSWDDLLHKYLRYAATRIEIFVQNSDSKEPLTYDRYPNGLSAIVIGGNSLSRGLTLEGLTVSYFYRNSIFYDTLMQMGRWFGYRPNYADLCRIWLTGETIDRYAHISDSVEELKRDLHEMNMQGLAPKDFGLRIREDPDAVLMITARNKMRHAEEFNVPVRIGGKLIDASRLRYEAGFASVNKNNESILSFLDKLPICTDTKAGLNRPHYFWRGISKQKVANLVRSIRTTHLNYNFQAGALADYIENEMKEEEWDIAIPEGDKFAETISINGQKKIIKPMFIKTDVREISGEEHIVIGGQHTRIAYPGLGKIGLTKEESTEIEESYPINPSTGKRKVVSASGYMKKDRNPLLLLYLVKPECAEFTLPDLICSIGIGFPGNDNRKARYRLNMVAIREQFNEGEEEEE